jgi:hypothetical protein
MTIILPALAVAFAAFCVWLGVRIVNRRDRWAKWSLAAVVGPPLLYILSFGPMCWYASRLIQIDDDRDKADLIGWPFIPLGKIAVDGPYLVRRMLVNYAVIGVPEGYVPLVPWGDCEWHGVE